MEIKKTQDGGQISLKLSGKLDTLAAPRLMDELIPEIREGVKVTLDLKELVYISSAGLRVLLAGEKAAKAKGARQTLINPSEDVMEVFELTGLSGVLDIER